LPRGDQGVQIGVPYKDPTKRRAHSAAYYRGHMDGTRAYNKNYRAAHSLDKCPHGRSQLERSCSLCRPDRTYSKFIYDEKRKFGAIPEGFMSWELYSSLIKRNCSWCGRTPEEVNGMSIDRRDNGVPHVAANVMPACADCNMMRRGLTMEEFMARVTRISFFQLVMAGGRCAY
jgi:hypothetical protein